jgi:hypothetical protein
MLGGRTYRSLARMARLAVITFSFFALAAPAAHATLRVANYNDPTGDPTQITYRLTRSDGTVFPTFTLGDGINRSFGVATGFTYTLQMVSPGWQAENIQCAGLSQSDFTVDKVHNQVTMVHGTAPGQDVEQTCTFTNGRVSSTGGTGGGSPSSGVSPSVPASELPRVTLPRGPAVVHVSAGRGFATAKVRLSRRSVVRCQLMRGKRVLASKRVTHSAGTYPCTVRLSSRTRRALRAQGLKKTTLTLKVVVAAGKATHVFRYRVIVKL